MKGGRGPFTPRFGHKPRGEGRPHSFHPSGLGTGREAKEGRGPCGFGTNRKVKEGRGPFTPQFGHKPRGEGRPRSFSPFCFAQKPTSEGRPRSFHPLVAATNREVKGDSIRMLIVPTFKQKAAPSGKILRDPLKHGVRSRVCADTPKAERSSALQLHMALGLQDHH